MSCDNCQHTMQNLGLDQAGRRSWWCPRCGSVKTSDNSGYESFEAPMIVARSTDYIADRFYPPKEAALKDCLKKTMPEM